MRAAISRTQHNTPSPFGYSLYKQRENFHAMGRYANKNKKKHSVLLFVFRWNSIYFFFNPLYAKYATTPTAITIKTMPISPLYSFTLFITASSVCNPGMYAI